MAKKVSKQKNISNTVFIAMARSGIRKQKELAEQAGIPYSTFNDYFRNATPWDLTALWKIDFVVRFTDAEWLAMRGR